MRKILEEKLKNQSFIFEQPEIHWLLENIGNEDPEIRDDLVFRIFAQAILKEAFSVAQFQDLVAFSLNQDLILYQLDKDFPAVLTRTFTALLNGYLIEADGNVASSYYHAMTAEERHYFFERAQTYLEKEHVFTGFSKKYGWVHGFAHGGDYLAEVVGHPDFPVSSMPKVLKTLQGVFERMLESFAWGEERRLAAVVCAALLSGKLSQEQLADWLVQLDFPLVELMDYTHLASFEIFCATIYFQLFEKPDFDEALKNELLKILRNF